MHEIRNRESRSGGGCFSNQSPTTLWCNSVGGKPRYGEKSYGLSDETPYAGSFPKSAYPSFPAQLLLPASVPPVYGVVTLTVILSRYLPQFSPPL